MSQQIPPGPWRVEEEGFYRVEVFYDSNGKQLDSEDIIACRDALTAAENRIRELEAQVDTLRRCTVRLADDVMFGDEEVSRDDFLNLVREVHDLRATVAALMPGDAGHLA